MIRPQADRNELKETLNHHEDVLEVIRGKCNGKVSFADFKRQLVAGGRASSPACLRRPKKRSLADHPDRSLAVDLVDAFAHSEATQAEQQEDSDEHNGDSHIGSDSSLVDANDASDRWDR